MNLQIKLFEDEPLPWIEYYSDILFTRLNDMLIDLKLSQNVFISVFSKKISSESHLK